MSAQNKRSVKNTKPELAIPWSSRREEYLGRINRVVDYIENNINGDLSLERLAGVACFSKYHFHRIFASMVGETLSDYIQRIRLEKAAGRLRGNSKTSVTEIVLDCGFSNPSTFARAFRDYFGMSATAWRAGKKPADRKIRQAVRNKRQEESGFPEYHGSDPNLLERRLMMKKNIPLKKPLSLEVKEFPEMHVAYLRHTGPYAGDVQLFGRLFGQLAKWAGPRGLIRPDAVFLTLYHDSPEVTDPGKLRISICLTVPEGTPVEGEIGKTAVHAGKYAVGRFEIKDDEYAGAWNHMFCVWLPDSGYQCDDFPCMEIYRNDPKEHPEHKHVVDICIPVKPL